MDGIHDMGGMHGFGAIEVVPDEPVFREAWEGRVWVQVGFVIGSGHANVDAFRHAIEQLDPTTYLSVGYYGRWLRALQWLVLDAGVVEVEELEQRLDALASGHEPPRARPAPPPRTPGEPGHGYRRPVDARPRYREGDAVRARRRTPPGHTRLPRYVRGHLGRIQALRGGFVLPDANAHGEGEQPEHLYTVCFDADALWGDHAEARSSVCVDLFESYLEPAETGKP